MYTCVVLYSRPKMVLDHCFPCTRLRLNTSYWTKIINKTQNGARTRPELIISIIICWNIWLLRIMRD